MPRKARRKPVARTTTRRPARKLSLVSRFKKMIGMPWFKNWRFADYLRVSLILAFWGAVVLLGLVFALSIGLPDIRKAVNMEERPMVIMRDKNGTEFSRSGAMQGEIVPAEQMSPHLIKAVLATEDRRFYKHWGVDPIGLARAVWANMRKGGVSQGGSTITQQLAKNLFLSPERTLTRKAKEALLALYLERRYTKNDILSAYLNRAYFGAGAYGADSAARVYFGTTARKLSLEQGAMLAGLLKAPTRYSPDNDPKLNVKRTRIVLANMVAAGYLRPGAEKMNLQPLPKREYNVGGSSDMRYYADWIISQVDAYTGDTPQDLVIDTTLDPAIQSNAQKTIRSVLEGEGKKLNVTQGALVSMKPDGAVVALVGGKDYNESQYNRAVVSARQPGSSFKTFIYLAALEAGYTPQTQMLDAPLKVGKYAPTNYDGKYHGYVSLQDSVAASLNTVAVRTLQDVGISRVINVAQRLGITDKMTHDLSLALGASDVHMLPITAAYAALANNGMAAEPYGIRMIRTTKGQVLYQRKDPAPRPVLNTNTVANMNQMLQSVVFYGTGKSAAIDRPVAGKTGTSSNYRDAWFIGYTPDYVTSVWVGNDNNTPMKRVTGGAMPARIWRDVMANAQRGIPVRPLITPATPEPVAPGIAPAPVEEEGTGILDGLIKSILGEDQPPAPAPSQNPPIEWHD